MRCLVNSEVYISLCHWKMSFVNAKCLQWWQTSFFNNCVCLCVFGFVDRRMSRAPGLHCSPLINRRCSRFVPKGLVGNAIHAIALSLWVVLVFGYGLRSMYTDCPVFVWVFSPGFSHKSSMELLSHARCIILFCQWKIARHLEKGISTSDGLNIIQHDKLFWRGFEILNYCGRSRI